MRKLIILIPLLFVFIGGYAQQEAQYTQFMYNKLSLNPAYAGSSETSCFSCIHRSQWVGFEGAPSSQVVNFHAPLFKQRVGLGASIAHDQIGPINSFTASLMYAYRMKIGKGNLALGLRGTLRNYRINWSETQSTHSGDEEIPTENSSRILPNFGFGVYYHTEKFYLGISTPSLLKGDLSYTYLNNSDAFGTENTHLYLMTGYVFKVNNNIKFKPAALVKYTANSPLDLDLNATFIFLDKLWFGVSYRLGGDANRGIGESIDLLAQYQISKKLRIGVAYDFTLSKLKDYNSGTFEIQMEYCLNPKDKRLTNPRFF